MQDPDEPGRASAIHGEGSSPILFQGRDDEAEAPMVDEGGHCLEQRDFAVAQAGARGIRSVLPFVGNREAFDGIDLYVRWRDLADDGDRVWYHDDFYTDEVIRGWYEDCMTYLLDRKNVYTGVAYKEDPNVLMWALSNEPRCRGTTLPSSPDACEPGDVGVVGRLLLAHLLDATVRAGNRRGGELSGAIDRERVAIVEHGERLGRLRGIEMDTDENITRELRLPTECTPAFAGGCRSDAGQSVWFERRCGAAGRSTRSRSKQPPSATSTTRSAEAIVSGR